MIKLEAIYVEEVPQKICEDHVPLKIHSKSDVFINFILRIPL